MSDEQKQPTADLSARLGPIRVDARAARDASMKLPLLLETGRLPGGFAATAALGIFALVGALLWGAFARFNEMAVASGALVPQGAVRAVEHLEGGIVDEIAIVEGQIVEPDQVLLRLRPNVAGGELSRLVQIRDAHRLRIAMLDALVNETPFVPEPALAMHPAAPNEVALYDARRQALEQERRGLQNEIANSETQRTAKQALLESLRTRERIAGEQLEMRAKLLERGFASQSALLDIQNELEEVRGSLARAEGELAALQQEDLRVRSKLTQLMATFRSDMLEQRSQALTELAVAEAEMTRLGDRVDRLEVRAPIRGIVKSIAKRGQGEVVDPGEMVAEIVPLTDTLQAELRLAPADAGHVTVGLPTQISINGFDRARFGSLKGEVRHISASTFTVVGAEPYYKVIVDLRDTVLVAGDVRHQLIPGMQVSAEIITGSRSFLAYLLKPVLRALENPFWER